MKTQIEEFENSRTFNTKVMLISLLVFACILIIVPIKGNWYNHSKSLLAFSNDFNNNNHANTLIALNSDKDSRNRANIHFTALAPIEAQMAKCKSTGLETNKLNQRLLARANSTCSSLLYLLADVEDPEYLIADAVPLLNKQVDVYNNNKQRFAQKENRFSHASYRVDNNGMLAQNEVHKQINSMMTLEDEDAQGIENWMTDQSIWNNTVQEESEVEDFSADLFATTKSETEEMAELIKKTKSYASMEVEEPLVIEHWMLCESFWCTNEKKTHMYKERFALNDEK